MLRQTLLNIAILFFFILPSTAQQDDIRFHRIGSREGLAQFMVFDIYQDVHGYMWFQDLFKYDGLEIKSYPNGSSQAVRVGELLSESWGKEPDSLFYYDPFKDVFIENYPRNFSKNLIPFGPWKDRNKNLWFIKSSNEGLYIYERSTKSFKNIRRREESPSSLSSDTVSIILKDRKEQIWVGTWDAGLNLWTKDSSFLHFRHQAENINSLSSDHITTLMEDKKGIIWIGTLEGLNRLNPVTREITRVLLPESIHKDVFRIFIDSSEKLWLLNNSGMTTYDPVSKDFQQYFVDENGQPIYPYPKLEVLPIVEDDQKRIWLGTAAWGIYIFDPATKKVTHYRNDPSDPESLSDDNIRPLVKDRDGRIWIGTFNGVNIYDPNDKAFVHLESDKEGTFFFNSHPKYDGLEDKNGNIWIADYPHQVIKFNPEKEEFKNYKIEGRGVTYRLMEDDMSNIWINSWDLLVLNPLTDQFTIKLPGDITAFDKDSKGQIWATSHTGLFVFPSPDSEPTLIKWDSIKGSLASDYNVLKIIEGCSGDLWMGTLNQGLLKYNPEDQLIRQFLPDAKNPNSIVGYDIGNGMAIDHDCNLWLSEQNGGLSMLPFNQQDKPDPVFRKWNTENSNLPDNGVTHVIVDKQGRIWVASGTAISQFDRSANTFQVYGPEDGMKTIPLGLIPSRDGRIYIRGMNGIGYFHPDQLAINRHIPPVYLKSIQINGRNLPIKGSSGDTLPFPSPLERSISFAKSIRLKHWQNEISLEFVALNYTTPIRNKFKYQLIGYDKNWKETDASQPFAKYTNLNPGTYTFRVIGSNNDSYWNEEGTSLQITISPPWYWAWWSQSFYALLILSLIYLFVLWRTAEQREKIEQQENELRRFPYIENDT